MRLNLIFLQNEKLYSRISDGKTHTLPKQNQLSQSYLAKSINWISFHHLEQQKPANQMHYNTVEYNTHLLVAALVSNSYPNKM